MPFGTDLRIIGGPGGSEDDLTGAGHASKPDTLNALSLHAHHKDGTHKANLLPVMCQCRLTKSGANLLFAPFGMGNLAPVKDSDGWFLRQVANAGITLATTGLSVSTLYRIYLYDSAGTLTLEASTTGTATDTDTGILIKSGDATRTFVGLAFTDSPLAFVDTVTQRWVRSWYNEAPVKLYHEPSNDLVTTSSTFVQIDDLSVSLVAFDNEILHIEMNGDHGASTGHSPGIGIGVDSTTVSNSELQSLSSFITGDGSRWMSIEGRIVLTEGKRDINGLAHTSGAVSSTFHGSATRETFRLTGTLLGHTR